MVDILSKLKPEDKEKIVFFSRILLRQEKYQKLKRKIEEREKEIREGETFTHDEIWKRFIS